MSSKNPQLINDEFYHIIKRGIEKRDIFLDDEDRFRFVNSLLVFNDKKPAPWHMRAFWSQRGPTSLQDYVQEDPFVEIHAFSLMRNHFHILVRQLRDNGISNFIKKLGGYSYYFNKKHKRIGPLFQGKFKAVLVKTDQQLRHNFVYVHTNPLEIIEFNWKEQGIKNPQKAVKFLENEYKWSSYPDYLGKENFPNVTKRDFFLKVFGDKIGCKREVNSWIKYKEEIAKIKDIMLE